MKCIFTQIGIDEQTGYGIFACENGCKNSHIKSPQPPERIHAICTGTLPTSGLGDLISNVLSKLGITEETVKRWLGIQAGCGCDKRKKFLNTILPLRKKE